MKRCIAVMLTVCMTFFVVVTTDRFAYAFGDTTKIAKTRGQNGDLSETPPDEGGEIIGTDTLTVEDKERIINNAELNPLLTGYTPLDSVVQVIFSEILTDDMSTYEKVCAIYAYLMEGRVYDRDLPYVDWLYYNIHNTINYRSDNDRNRVCEAYGFLTREDGYENNKGVCQHYNSAFVVMTRALGLDTFVVDCTATAGTEISSHVCSVLRTNGTYYLFDPVMGVYLGNSEVETSAYFCTPLEYHPLREYCNMNEMINSFGYFETKTGGTPMTVEEIPGATEGEFHFAYGSYPQTQVTDSELIAALNGLLNVNNMLSYGYYSGEGTVGSQTQSDYMRYADIEYEGEKYRAVRFSAYRPTYSYMPSEEGRSYQDNNGFFVNETYWFRFDPIEWRLVDGGLDNGSLLLADLALDAQPYNFAIYASETAKIIDGKEYYVFKDEACTQPVNDWSTSDIRAWLNEDFLNTAFTDEEKALLANSSLHNYGVHGYYDYEDTVDQVFLLSYNEVKSEAYFLGSSDIAKVLQGTDYARCQGLSVDTASQNSPCTWILRSAGDHSNDISFVNSIGRTKIHMYAASEMCGIRPALRVSDLAALIPDAPVAPGRLTAIATDTGEITLRVAVCNGAASYRFFIYTGDEEEPVILDSEKPMITVNDLTPGQTYRVCAAAITLTGEQENVGPTTEIIQVLCRAFLNPPETMQATASATQTITLSWTPVDGAVLYRVYRYIDSETLALCGETSDTSLGVENLGIGYCYYFRISSVSVDGLESKLSDYSVSCQSESIPATPLNLTSVPSATGKLHLSWDASPGAAMYYIERYRNGGFELVDTTAGTEYTVDGLSVGSTYTFYVSAETADGSSRSIRVNATAQCISIPSVPQDLTISTIATGVMKLSWSACDGAARYYIERFKTNAYVEIAVTENTEITVPDLSVGTDYYFRIYAETADKSSHSDFAKVNAVCESIPAAPANLTIYTVSTGVMKLSWSACDGAAKYYIERISNGVYVPIGDTEDTEYTVFGLTAGSTYYFRVITETADGTDQSVPAYGNATCESIPAAPLNLTSVPFATGKLHLSWDASPGAALYYIERYRNDGFELVGTTEGTEYTVDGLSVGSTYTFYVSAETADGSSRSIRVNATAQCISIPSVPQNLVISTVATGVMKLSWSACDGAARYRIERNISGTYTEIADTEDTEYTVSGLSAGTNYYFQVRAETENGSSRSGYAKVNAVCESIPPIPQNLTFETVSNGTVRLNWEASEGAARYRVERIKSGEYIDLGITTDTEFTATGLSGGVTYYFRVIAETEGGADSSAPASGCTICRKAPVAPENPVVQVTGDRRLTVSWDEVEGATEYDVYRSTGSADDYAYLATTADLFYVDSDGLSVGTNCFYKVVAVDKGNTYRLESSKSLCANAIALGAPAAPVGLTAASNAPNTVTVGWSPVTTATKYNVYRYRGTDKTYIYIGSTTTTSYDITGLSAGTTYYFKVEAVTEVGDMSFTGSKSVSFSTKVISMPSQVTGLTVEATGDKKLTLRWSASANATEYDIYRYSGVTNSYVFKATTPNLSYVDSDNLSVGTSYYYRVVAANKGANYRLEAPKSACANALVLGTPATPVGLTAVSNAPNTVTVSWTKVKNATKYNIYRYRGTDKIYIYLGSTTKTSYDVTGLNAGTTYYFKVEAVSEVNNTSYIGSRSASVSAKVIDTQAPVTGLTVEATGDKKLTLRWSASAGATQYDIYRYTGVTNTYVYKATTSNLFYVDSDNLSVGTSYYYRVVAVKKTATYQIESVKSSCASALVLGTPVAPTGVTAVSYSANKVTVGWSAVKAATKYNIYRYRGTDKTYIYLGSTTKTSYDVTGLSTGTTYYFKVEAVVEGNNISFTGSKSASVSATVK